MTEIILPRAGPPQIPPLPKDCYERMGEKNIFQMLEDFYLELSESSIRELFPDDLIEASRKSAAFFVFFMGGPPLYHQRYGPPRLRMRHMPFAIDRAARDVWLECFHRILEGAEEKYDFPMDHMDHFLRFLDEFSLFMVNR